MVNPHWDEEITEDIGFQGPHFNESIQETWSPQGEFGQHGEFEGWRSAEDPPSYTSDWQDYPADEFTGIETLKKNPWDFGRGALRGIPSSAISGNRRGPGPWNDFSVGYDRDYTGPWIDNSYGMMDNDMMDEIMMAELSAPQLNFMAGPYGNPGGGGYTDSPAGWEDYKYNVNKHEDKGGILPWWLGGRSPQEPATDKEIMDELIRNIRNKQWKEDTPSKVSPNWRVTT